MWSVSPVLIWSPLVVSYFYPIQVYKYFLRTRYTLKLKNKYQVYVILRSFCLHLLLLFGFLFFVPEAVCSSVCTTIQSWQDFTCVARRYGIVIPPRPTCRQIPMFDTRCFSSFCFLVVLLGCFGSFWCNHGVYCSKTCVQSLFRRARILHYSSNVLNCCTVPVVLLRTPACCTAALYC